MQRNLGGTVLAHVVLREPEGELALAELVIYLSLAPQSVAAYQALGKAQSDVRELGTLPVPLAIRNAPTKLMKSLGYGREYQYDPEVEGGVALDMQCLPDELAGRSYYLPVTAGLELKLKEKLDALRAARRAALEGRGGPA